MKWHAHFLCLAVFLGFSIGAVFSQSAGAVSAQRIKFATLAPEGSAWINGFKRLTADIRARSGGTLDFVVFAGGVAGDELDVLRKMHVGQIQAAAFSGVGLGQILPSVRVLDLPLLFQNDAEVDFVHEDLFPFFAGEFRKKGFVLLAWAEVGQVYLFSDRPISGVKDISQARVWAWTGDPLAKETFNAMGISPITLPATDVTTALGTGMVNTVYAPLLGALAMQWYRQVQYVSTFPISHATGAILMRAADYERLTVSQRELIQGLFPAAMQALTVELRQQEPAILHIMQQGGLAMAPAPDAGQRAQLGRIRDRVAHALEGNLFPADLLKRIRDLLGASRRSDR